VLEHTSLVSLDVADTVSDTLFRGHSRCSADGIAAPLPGLSTARPSSDTVELTGDDLKNRTAIEPHVSAGHVTSGRNWCSLDSASTSAFGYGTERRRRADQAREAAASAPGRRALARSRGTRSGMGFELAWDVDAFRL
jgi:hypothetical protein